MQDLTISDVEVVPCTNSKYIKTSRVRLNQNGRQRTWDYINVHDCVVIMLLNTTRNAFILVRQFRPALYMYINNEQTGKERSEISEDKGEIEIKAPFQTGVSYELCAGLIDKMKPAKEIAKEEVLEEVGYDISIDQLQEVVTARSVGIDGRKVTIFYAEVTDDMIVGPGGGQLSEAEEIEVEYLPVEKAKEFVFDESKVKPTSLITAFMWYFWKNNVL